MVIPNDLLAKSKKILFVTHLAIGDFTYLQNCFKAFTEAYPHLRVHLWVDEIRRTRNSAKWEGLRKNSLYDWVTACPYFEKVYTQTYSPGVFKESLLEARQEQYPLVVSLAGLRAPFYASLARSISRDGFVVGVRKRVKFYQLHHMLHYRKLDATLPPYSQAGQKGRHVSEFYAARFQSLFDLDMAPQARFPFVELPDEAVRYAETQLTQWGFSERKVIFVNSFATTVKRSWPVDRVAELIAKMQRESEWRDACFVVNSMPRDVERVQQVLSQHGLERTRVFTAANFFRLPAILSRCDLVISVETATIHLANAVKVPVVALMRTKTPQWAPVDQENSLVVTCRDRNDWVRDIGVDQVMARILQFRIRERETGAQASFS